ncbi:MAG: hypothetical protein QF511_06030 [Rhodospirillales bacterium]|jgi:hypothetical protein|nr:hypothetical protein [Rhodospirillales bacterium]
MFVDHPLPIDNSDSDEPLAVMTVDDTRKFWIISTHWPVLIVGSPVAGEAGRAA